MISNNYPNNFVDDLTRYCAPLRRKKEEILEHFESRMNAIFQERPNLLTPKEKRIFELRYIKANTFESIGRELGGLTRERIRQFCTIIIRKFQDPTIASYFLGENYVPESINEAEMKRVEIDAVQIKEEIKKAMLDSLDAWLRGDADKTCFNDMVKQILSGKKKNNRIEDLNLSTRSYNALKKAGYVFISEVPNNKYELKAIRELGNKSVNEILEKLANFH